MTHKRNTAASYSAQSSMQSGLEEEKKKIQLMLQDRIRQKAVIPDSYNTQSSPHEQQKKKGPIFMLMVLVIKVR